MENRVPRAFWGKGFPTHASPTDSADPANPGGQSEFLFVREGPGSAGWFRHHHADRRRRWRVGGFTVILRLRLRTAFVSMHMRECVGRVWNRSPSGLGRTLSPEFIDSG